MPAPDLDEELTQEPMNGLPMLDRNSESGTACRLWTSADDDRYASIDGKTRPVVCLPTFSAFLYLFRLKWPAGRLLRNEQRC